MPRPNRGHRLEPNDHGYYEIRWTERGRSKRVSTGTRDMGEAAQFLVGWLDGKAAGAGQAALTVREAWAFYEREHVDTKVVDAAGSRGVGKMLCAVLGDRLVPDLVATDFTAYGRKHGGAPGTIRRHLALLQAAFNFCAENRRMSRDDVPNIELPEPPRPRERWLSREEAARLLDAAQRLGGTERYSRAYRFCLIALRTAARESAIERLRWDTGQIDFEARRIDFNEPGRRETKKRRARVPMTDDLFAMLQRAYGERTSEWVLDHPSKIDRAFARARDAAGLAARGAQKVTPHTLRHTWATWALQDGNDIWQVAGVLADSPATVQKIYGHHCPDHLREAVQSTAEGGRLAGRNAQVERRSRPTTTDKAA